MLSFKDDRLFRFNNDSNLVELRLQPDGVVWLIEVDHDGNRIVNGLKDFSIVPSTGERSLRIYGILFMNGMFGGELRFNQTPVMSFVPETQLKCIRH